MRRNLLSEWFFIEQGKIRSIVRFDRIIPYQRGTGAELAAAYDDAFSARESPALIEAHYLSLR